MKPFVRAPSTVVISFMAHLSACVPEASDPAAALLAELDGNRAKWVAQAIDTYEFRFINACNCPPDITQAIVITVEDNQVVEIRAAENGEPIELRENGYYPTIERLFDTVQLAIDSPAAAISVEYDDELGHPKQLYIDWNAGTADEESSFSASNLVTR